MNQQMFKHIFILTGLVCVLLACKAPTDADITKPAWELTQTSTNGLFKVRLRCQHLPSVGSFQDCQLELTDGSGKAIHGANIKLDGGMPKHGHGLPTAPVVSPLAAQGHYKIEGLQYNMPGAWLLGLLIKTPAGQDKLVFSFEISNLE
ncbi:YtkA-like [Thiothrix eikelboomii]|uniref:YtkA-like n=2 Tax=Thiothrix eikelboomii TaxID=92487 RepID=A0A1T4XDH6_9GAMM|nr:YtkA-like [Thiothrix eikelboomii]